MIVDRDTGAGSISAGVVILDPGAIIPAHTHLVEECVTILEGDARALVGDKVAEIRGGGATVLAPANIVHGMRNIGSTPLKLVIAYPAVEVGSTRVEKEV